MKGPLSRPLVPLAGLFVKRRFDPGPFGSGLNVRLADLAATYSPAS